MRETFDGENSFFQSFNKLLFRRIHFGQDAFDLVEPRDAAAVHDYAFPREIRWEQLGRYIYVLGTLGPFSRDVYIRHSMG